MQNKKTKNRRDKRLYAMVDKASKGCSVCGETNPIVLSYHHHGEKNGGVSEMISNQTSWKKLLEEIDSTEVLCENHHRIRHFQERKRNGR